MSHWSDPAGSLLLPGNYLGDSSCLYNPCRLTLHKLAVQACVRWEVPCRLQKQQLLIHTDRKVGLRVQGGTEAHLPYSIYVDSWCPNHRQMRTIDLGSKPSPWKHGCTVVSSTAIHFLVSKRAKPYINIIVKIKRRS